MNLEELKALCENATPGPWEVKREESFHKSVIAEPDRYGTKYIAEWIFQGPDSGESDAQFIAAARTALPKLIYVVEEILGLDSDYIAEGEELHPDNDSNDNFDGGFWAGMDRAFELIYRVINTALEES